MRLSVRAQAAAVAAALVLPLAPGAGADTSSLSSSRPAVSWTAVSQSGDGCLDATETCHVQELAVRARAGSLVTVEVRDEGWVLEVLAPDGSVVARDGRVVRDTGEGPGEETENDADPASDVTFEHRGDPAPYRVRVSLETGVLGGEGLETSVTARLGGRGLDRDPQCDAVVVVPLGASDEGRRLAAHVRVVVPPELAADVREAVPVAVDAYAAIGVDLRVSYDVTALPPGVNGAAELRGWARSRYGGRRPTGVDAVYVANDVFGGGQADCLGGVLHPEQGFSVGQVHYSPENTLPGGTGTVSAGVILAHEVGHTFGGHHEQGNCAEAAPGQAGHGTSPESRGPCTIMSPAALTVGRSFGTVEAIAIRGVLLRRR